MLVPTIKKNPFFFLKWYIFSLFYVLLWIKYRFTSFTNHWINFLYDFTQLANVFGVVVLFTDSIKYSVTDSLIIKEDNNPYCLISTSYRHRYPISLSCTLCLKHVQHPVLKLKNEEVGNNFYIRKQNQTSCMSAVGLFAVTLTVFLVLIYSNTSV